MYNSCVRQLLIKKYQNRKIQMLAGNTQFRLKLQFVWVKSHDLIYCKRRLHLRQMRRELGNKQAWCRSNKTLFTAPLKLMQHECTNFLQLFVPEHIYGIFTAGTSSFIFRRQSLFLPISLGIGCPSPFLGSRPLNQTRAFGERCKLPQRSTKTHFVHFFLFENASGGSTFAFVVIYK